MAQTGPMSGFRDLLAEDMIPRQAMLHTIEQVYRRYGFVPLQTPVLERYDTLTGKYGDEGEKLMYHFVDNGAREVAMRYDMTVPLARVVAQYGSRLPRPYKRYTIGSVFRGESPQAGRYREFTQFDADIVGTNSPLADAEVVAMMHDTTAAFGVDARVRVNNRLLLDALAASAGAKDQQQSLQLIMTVDKIDKIGKDAVLEAVGKRFGAAAVSRVDSYLSVKGSPQERLRQMRQLFKDSETARAGIDNLARVFSILEASGHPLDRIVFDPAIARGLDYYTGIIYETVLIDAPEFGSVCGGGRYDKLVKALGGPDLPAVGTSIGVDRLFDGLRRLGKLEEARTPAEVLVANFEDDQLPAYMRLATELRRRGVPAEVPYAAGKVGNQLGLANTMRIPYVVMVGPKEREAGVGVIKSLGTGEQMTVPRDDIAETVLKLRQSAQDAKQTTRLGQ